MIVRYCSSCIGAPYTKDTALETCPICGSRLETEFIQDESALWGREEIVEDPFGPSPFGPEDADNPFAKDADDPFSDSSPFSPAVADDSPFGRGAGHTESGFASPRRDTSGLPQSFSFDIQDHQTIQPTHGASPSLDYGNQESLGAPRRSVHNTPQARGQAADSSVVTGRVANYSNSSLEPGEYHRNILQKMVDAIVYGQRTDDIIHRFMVRTDDEDPMGGGYRDIFVNVHGTIAGGMQLSDNQTVEVHGRYRDGVLIAKKIYILTGAGKTTVNFQHEMGGVALFGGLLLFAAFLLLGGFGDPSSMLGGAGAFLSEWLVMLVFAAIIWFFVLSKLGSVGRSIASSGGKTSLVGVLVLSVVMTLIFTNTLGLGNAAGSAVDSILDYVIALSGPIITILLMLYGIYRMIKL